MWLKVCVLVYFSWIFQTTYATFWFDDYEDLAPYQHIASMKTGLILRAMALYRRKMELLGYYPRIYDYDYNYDNNYDEYDYNDLDLYYDRMARPQKPKKSKLKKVYVNVPKNKIRKSKSSAINRKNPSADNDRRRPNQLIEINAVTKSTPISKTKLPFKGNTASSYFAMTNGFQSATTPSKRIEVANNPLFTKTVQAFTSPSSVLAAFVTSEIPTSLKIPVKYGSPFKDFFSSTEIPKIPSSLMTYMTRPSTSPTPPLPPTSVTETGTAFFKLPSFSAKVLTKLPTSPSPPIVSLISTTTEIHIKPIEPTTIQTTPSEAPKSSWWPTNAPTVSLDPIERTQTYSTVPTTERQTVINSPDDLLRSELISDDVHPSFTVSTEASFVETTTLPNRITFSIAEISSRSSVVAFIEPSITQPMTENYPDAPMTIEAFLTDYPAYTTDVPLSTILPIKTVKLDTFSEDEIRFETNEDSVVNDSSTLKPMENKNHEYPNVSRTTTEEPNQSTTFEYFPTTKQPIFEFRNANADFISISDDENGEIEETNSISGNLETDFSTTQTEFQSLSTPLLDGTNFFSSTVEQMEKITKSPIDEVYSEINEANDLVGTTSLMTNFIETTTVYHDIPSEIPLVTVDAVDQIDIRSLLTIEADDSSFGLESSSGHEENYEENAMERKNIMKGGEESFSAEAFDPLRDGILDGESSISLTTTIEPSDLNTHIYSRTFDEIDQTKAFDEEPSTVTDKNGDVENAQNFTTAATIETTVYIAFGTTTTSEPSLNETETTTQPSLDGTIAIDWTDRIDIRKLDISNDDELVTFSKHTSTVTAFYENIENVTNILSQEESVINTDSIEHPKTTLSAENKDGITTTISDSSNSIFQAKENDDPSFVNDHPFNATKDQELSGDSISSRLFATKPTTIEPSSSVSQTSPTSVHNIRRSDIVIPPDDEQYEDYEEYGLMAPMPAQEQSRSNSDVISQDAILNNGPTIYEVQMAQLIPVLVHQIKLGRLSDDEQNTLKKLFPTQWNEIMYKVRHDDVVTNIDPLLEKILKKK